MHHWRLVAAAALAVTAGPLPAQTAAIKKAAETITKEDVARHVGVIADDSMLGRDTPSRGLELTAQYVADHFKRSGLKPGGDHGGWLQRFPFQSDTVLVPNVVGVLEGSDPKLKDEYLVFVAHMDHDGIKKGGGFPDSIYNGADDNASGTAGVLELAGAFTRRGARPRRSIIFLVVSGEEKGLWGSRYFVDHPAVPLEQIVANVNLDGIGRGEGDTVHAHGGQGTYLGALADRVNAAHPELRLTVILKDAPPNSDHVSFQEREIPFLSMDVETRSPDTHKVTDSPEKIHAEMEARMLRLVFYLGQEIANADERPR